MNEIQQTSSRAVVLSPGYILESPEDLLNCIDGQDPYPNIII
jgi:hypothetical protein